MRCWRKVSQKIGSHLRISYLISIGAFNTAFEYLSSLALFDAMDWHAEVIGGDFHAEVDDLVQPLRAERASESR